MRKSISSPFTSEPAHRCAVQGCNASAEYKAPQARNQLTSYQYLCLEHVRDFNQRWDYFAGWDSNAIEDFRYNAQFGHRPTWKMGSQPVFTAAQLCEHAYRLLHGEAMPVYAPQHLLLPPKTREALSLLGLETLPEIKIIKATYKKLVKQYHPDLNKGNRKAEDMFKRITIAYRYLCTEYGRMT